MVGDRVPAQLTMKRFGTGDGVLERAAFLGHFVSTTCDRVCRATAKDRKRRCLYRVGPSKIRIVALSAKIDSADIPAEMLETLCTKVTRCQGIRADSGRLFSRPVAGF